ncbi:hypothetical protein PI124_g3611 [Phytophthora idaei]|nr:hypothetical protein PI125_g11430 [Phytophthora idaei]KAG3151735.1 hypothetical protein PI126_g10847 [Phytophthora idaei]KAG3251753.1 hypothetical protein PI124_g3611 [Phytophthora idaei]
MHALAAALVAALIISPTYFTVEAPESPFFAASSAPVSLIITTLRVLTSANNPSSICSFAFLQIITENFEVQSNCVDQRYIFRCQLV